MENNAFEMNDKDLMNAEILKQTIASNSAVDNMEEYFKDEKKKLLAKLEEDIKLSKIKEGIIYSLSGLKSLF